MYYVVEYFRLESFKICSYYLFIQSYFFVPDKSVLNTGFDRNGFARDSGVHSGGSRISKREGPRWSAIGERIQAPKAPRR